MDIVIRERSAADLSKGMDIRDCFIVDSILDVTYKDQCFGYTVREIPAYTKTYGGEAMTDDEYSEYIDNPDGIIYLALLQDHVVGEIILKKNWNHYAIVEDIKVDESYRRYGIGRKLIDQAKYWAKAGGMPGLMLETQTNNVRACKFYESCGFAIGGMDLYLYKGAEPHHNETAIFWYFLFE
ncbi:MULTISPECIES: GNAT family N-acetyltransferase [Paenibacillus]|uniref:GNAT family N-acetyltransferase n=1 Tax=Paenibacillus TaxID=44249 RepID=UPI0022B9154A|nr:GNAT family N-acetyltransferase [Paenibacillus caseinilyticus]MCZ8519603.1 GNAT family N-acetyltransferase [Paenibacillus caseinilyticus]